PQEAAQVIARRCYAAGVQLIDVTRQAKWRRLHEDLHHQTVRVRWAQTSIDLTMHLLGEFQMENAATVTMAFEALRRSGVPLKREHLEQGMAAVRWPGRLQVLQEQPLLVVDGAHNGASAERLAAALQSEIPHRRLVL